MKYLSCLLIIALTGCNSDDNTSKNYLKSLEGRYKLIEIHTETPVDLNFDGLKQTDLMEEIDCYMAFTLSQYRALIDYQNLFDERATLDVEVPESVIYSEIEPFSQCFNNGQLYYEKFEVNEDTGEIIILARDEERELLLGKLISGKIIGDSLYFKFEVPLFTSEGWQTVIINEVFKKYIYND